MSDGKTFFIAGILASVIGAFIYFAVQNQRPTHLPERVVTELENSGVLYVRGESAPVVVTIFSDYECPSCRGLHGHIKNVLNDYIESGDIQLRIADVILPIHEKGVKTATYAYCLNEQSESAHWSFRDAVSDRDFTAATSDEYSKRVDEVAQSLSTGKDRLSECMSRPSHPPRLERAFSIAFDSDFTYVPVVSVNNNVVPTSSYQRIEAELKLQIEEAITSSRQPRL